MEEADLAKLAGAKKAAESVIEILDGILEEAEIDPDLEIVLVPLEFMERIEKLIGEFLDRYGNDEQGLVIDFSDLLKEVSRVIREA